MDMAANGRGIMRPGGKSPPFLAIGLVVTIIILGFNYWSLSAKNGEQANEIALMESELRLVNAKKVSAEKRSDAISDKVKDLEEEIQKQKEAIASLKNDQATLELAKKRLEKENEDFKSQLVTAATQKETCEKELQNKKIDLDNEQKKGKTCSESECVLFVTETRQKVLKEVHEAAGSQPLVKMLEKNMDLGDLRESVISMKTVLEQGGKDQPLKAGQLAENQPAGDKGEPVKTQHGGVAPVNHEHAKQVGPQIPNANEQQGQPKPVGPSKLEADRAHEREKATPKINDKATPKINDNKVDLEENEDPNIKEGDINHVAHDEDEYDDEDDDDADKVALRYEQKEENNDVKKDDEAVDFMAQRN
ncbi:Golgi membrane protein 1-like isoform X2 [Dreissena polymorpha]|uniref:Golgi membrane protein 1-like isoform X2 n=1 Tax=Dreissena polymorpha TaxID=45954 RepID=UPI0022653BCB|nr:Golgi membrane protein 1-like isoform X2 [Dreissena polymorpha]